MDDPRVVRVEDHVRLKKSRESLVTRLKRVVEEKAQVSETLNEYEAQAATFEATYTHLQQDNQTKTAQIAHLEEQVRLMRISRDASQSEVSAQMVQFDKEKEQWERELNATRYELETKRKVLYALVRHPYT